MPSDFADEFRTAAYPDIQELFAETVTIRPLRDKNPIYGPYTAEGIFVLPQGEVDIDPPSNLSFQRIDFLIRSTLLEYPPEIGDRIERTVNGETETWKVSEDNIEPHQQFNDPLGIQVRLHLVKVKTSE